MAENRALIGSIVLGDFALEICARVNEAKDREIMKGPHHGMIDISRKGDLRP